MKNITLLLTLSSLVICQLASAQANIFQKISLAVDADLKSEGFSNTLDVLDKEGCLLNYDVNIPYLETQKPGKSKFVVRINTDVIADDKDIMLISRGSGSSDVSDFYRSDKMSTDNDFTYIHFGEYFDSKLNLEENQNKGFKNLASLLRLRNYKYVIILDDFGLSPFLIGKVKEYFADQRSTIFIMPYNSYKANFPEASYYYTEISSSSKLETFQKVIYKFQNRPQTTQNLSMTAILPKDGNNAQATYLKSVIYSYVILTKQMPGVHLSLYIVDMQDVNLLKKKLFSDQATSNFSLGNIIYRNINSIFPQKKLFAEGQNVGNIQTTLNASRYTFMINYTENDNSRETLISSPDDLALVIGPANSDNTWQKFDQTTLDDLVRFQRSYIQTIITTKSASDKPKPKPNAGF